MTSNQTYQFWVTCPQGVHGLLKQELSSLADITVGDWHKGVQFTGTLEDAYRVCLWSRLANRVYLALGETAEVSYDALEALVQSVQWDDHLRPSGTLKVVFTGHLPEIRDTRFGAQKVKDWVVDQIREKHGVRPNVDPASPDLSIFAQVARKKLFLGIEMTGESLHRRGYRRSTGPAPIKENLAAAMLLAADWPARAERGEAFLDLMCGSGTIVTEAAMIAADYAPGLGRAHFGFERWLQHSVNTWRSLQAEARERREQGTKKMPPVLGYDSDGGVIASANATLEKLGLNEHARCYHKPLDEWTLPTHWSLKPGLWVSNPPYGERLGDKPTLLRTYRKIGQIARDQLSGWELGMLTSDDILAREIGFKPHTKRHFFNGPIETTFYQFTADESQQSRQADNSEQIQAFKNRLQKNRKQLKKWLAKEQIEAYRVYDADIPEFALAIDVYGDWLHVQEYAPPKNIPEQKAQQRVLQAVDALSDVFEMPFDHIVVKRRERQKGTKQYEKKDSRNESFQIREYGVELKINLHDYLDTGLFLDHRNMRKRVQDEARGKRVLNLFCYTGSFSAHAYVGGAASTTNVDLSKTYLSWAKVNLELNGGKVGPKHHFIHSDCMQWLADCKDAYDLIVMDPPTFSNSARMKDTLDVQRDHEFLVNKAMSLLTHDGVLIFSNNYKKFHLDESLYEKYAVKDVSNQSVPKDFSRTKPHRCFEIRHKA